MNVWDESFATSAPAAAATVESLVTSVTCSFAAMLDREALEERVGVGGVAHLQRAARVVLPHTVEHDDPAGPAHRDEARERVHQLAHVGERSGVQQVVAVEQVDGRGHRARHSARRRGLVQQHRRRDADVQRLDRPCSGIETSPSHMRRTSGRRPLPSAPKTSASPPARSASHIGVAPSPVAAP